MKSEIFNKAIAKRNRLRFLYGLDEIIVEPYYLSKNNLGKKVLYGKVSNTNQIRMFEYHRITNIKVLSFNRFSPIIPILPIAN